MVGAGVMLVVTVLAVVVVAGMVTGTGRKFDKGEAELYGVVAVEVIGAVCLASLAGLGRACIRFVNERRSHLMGWVTIAAALWLLWSELRLNEYAS